MFYQTDYQSITKRHPKFAKIRAKDVLLEKIAFSGPLFCQFIQQNIETPTKAGKTAVLHLATFSKRSK